MQPERKLLNSVTTRATSRTTCKSGKGREPRTLPDGKGKTHVVHEGRVERGGPGLGLGVPQRFGDDVLPGFAGLKRAIKVLLSMSVSRCNLQGRHKRDVQTSDGAYRFFAVPASQRRRRGPPGTDPG